MKNYITLVLFFIVTDAMAYQFKVRAREHFERHEIHTKDSLDLYQGLTNTINLWWEKPYDTYFGFSFSPVLASIKEIESDGAYGDKITQQNIGLEYKKFPKLISEYFYFRLGLGYSRLETNQGDVKNYFGNYGYIGLGREIPIKNFGLALEMAYRYSDYNRGLYIKTITPSVGFHFYKDF